MTPPLHLVTVWNPSYAEDAMDAHLRVFLGWARKATAGELDSEDVYVWWAKLRSPNRQGPLPHAEEVLSLQDQINQGTETHLYLTDYRSLYVGHLLELTSVAVPDEWPDEADHMPAYYEDRPADFWFRLYDLRRLVASDTPATIEELRRLRNTRYHDRPVSLYGGMVELPLIVTREEEAGWFADRDILTGGTTWAERDASLRSETDRLSAELRDNLLGPAIWHAMEPASRTFLAAAEAVFRARRTDPDFDFSGSAVEYAKAVETELNALLFPALRRVLHQAKPAEREIHFDGHRLDLGARVPHQTLGALRNLLGHDGTVRGALDRALRHDASWLKDQLPYRLERLVELRNPAAHSEPVSADVLAHEREAIVGIGREGLLVKVVRAKMRSRQ